MWWHWCAQSVIVGRRVCCCFKLTWKNNNKCVIIFVVLMTTLKFCIRKPLAKRSLIWTDRANEGKIICIFLITETSTPLDCLCIHVLTYVSYIRRLTQLFFPLTINLLRVLCAITSEIKWSKFERTSWRRRRVTSQPTRISPLHLHLYNFPIWCNSTRIALSLYLNSNNDLGSIISICICISFLEFLPDFGG